MFSHPLIHGDLASRGVWKTQKSRHPHGHSVLSVFVPQSPLPLPFHGGLAADATVRAPLRREKSFSARSFDADDHPVHALNTDESWSSAGRIRWLKLACSLTQVFAAVPAHTERGDGEQFGSQLKVGYA